MDRRRLTHRNSPNEVINKGNATCCSSARWTSACIWSTRGESHCTILKDYCCWWEENKRHAIRFRSCIWWDLYSGRCKNHLVNHVDRRCLRILPNRYWTVFLMGSTLLYSLTELRGAEKRTRSGKFWLPSHTYWSGTPENPGLIYLTTQELFERCAALTDKKVDITLSFLEIYNETIRDLLAPVEESKVLQLREDAQHRISVPGLTTASPVTVSISRNLAITHPRLTR